MDQKIFNKRVLVSSGLIVIIFVVLIIRIFSLHFSAKIIVPPLLKPEIRRGYIRDRNGYILAMSIEEKSLFANPSLIQKPGETARLISPIIGEPVQAIEAKLTAHKNKKFIWLKRKLPIDKVLAIEKLGINGFNFKREFKRVYPHGRLASNIIGFVGIDNRGLEGLEYQFNKVLSGSIGVEKGLQVGNDIRLTIDRLVQFVCEDEIKKAVLKYKAKQGIITVVEVKTGRILAMAKYPDFDPNNYSEFSSFERRNFSIIDSFEPGSTFKVISMAAILEYKPGLIKNKYTCKGKIDIADVSIGCTGIHGTIDLHDVIRHSCNIGMIKAIRNIKKNELYAMLTRFGFGSRTGIELPAETDGILRNVAEWSGLSKYSMAIGHEISVTSVQLVSAYGAIANRGLYYAPSIIESIENSEGTVIQHFYPRTKGRIIKEAIATKLLQMMRGVVENGSATTAASQYYKVAGKTGTSQKFVKKENKYSDRVVSSFIGIAPYENPDVCILIVIDDSKYQLSGGQIAAPVFPRIIDRILPQRGIKDETLKAKPLLNHRNPQLNYEGSLMPDFNGMRLPACLRALTAMKKKLAVTYTFSGTGTVYKQKPEPGSMIDKDTQIQLYLKE